MKRHRLQRYSGRKLDHRLAHSGMVLSFLSAAALLLSAGWGEVSPRSATELQSTQATPSSTQADPSPQVPPIASFRNALYPVIPLDRVYLMVSLSDRQVTLYEAGEVQAQYPVAVGQPGWETPTGTFNVNHKQKNPAWQHPLTKEVVPPGADNPLGSRWIGFWSEGEYQIGFHGTNQPDLLGEAVSHGCLRMREADIQALYEQVTVGTVVVVRP